MTVGRSSRWRPPRHAQHGATLLESLLALLVFSFGVLGVVALEAQSIRHVNDAQCRGAAIHLADALIGRMWADNRKDLEAAYGRTDGSGYLAWRDAVARLPGAALPGNEPTVTVAPGPSTTSSNVTVTIRWQLPGETVPHSYRTTAVVGQQD
jgi:type IV pilus assembly protein PilV